MIAGGHVWWQGACVVAGGACVVAGEVCVVARGCVWLLGAAWLLGGMRGGGVCMVGGHAWSPGGAYVGYDEIRSMGGRYASYWNAFLYLQ